MEIVIFAQLIAVRAGTYTVYVFVDNKTEEYIMCTRMPNWQVPDLTLGDEGFLKYKTVSAGESYYEPSTGTTLYYLYSNIYFLNFVKKQEITNSNIIL